MYIKYSHKRSYTEAHTQIHTQAFTCIKDFMGIKLDLKISYKLIKFLSHNGPNYTCDFYLQPLFSITSF